MAWSGSLTAGSAAGTSITFTPDTSEVGAYTVAAFTAPRKGVYRFECRGSGGHNGIIDDVQQTPGRYIGTGGAGGKTVCCLLLEAGQTVYVGAGGPCSAAFVAGVNGASLAAIAKAYLHGVAGGGGGGGATWGSHPQDWAPGDGGDGGGASGAAGTSRNSGVSSGSGGTQTSGHAYGTGEASRYGNEWDTSSWSGRGGDGLYGGRTGASLGSNGAGGAGGGSGYIAAQSLTAAGTTYANTTAQGGGAAAGQNGSVQVTYAAAGELPVIFNGAHLTELIFNGVKVGSLIYNGTKLFCRRAEACFTRMARRSLSRRATPACSP